MEQKEGCKGEVQNFIQIIKGNLEDTTSKKTRKWRTRQIGSKDKQW
jgi:hypothetical protein